MDVYDLAVYQEASEKATTLDATAFEDWWHASSATVVMSLRCQLAGEDTFQWWGFNAQGAYRRLRELAER